FEDYQHTFCGVSGPEGTFVRVGTSGTGTTYSYKERKLRDSKGEIEDIASRLSFSDARTREVKNMVMKVTDGEFGLELKEFDLVGLLEKTFRRFTGFSEVDKEKIDMMVKQGNFVIQCTIKWFLTTGRRPGPVVVAVLVFVGAVNGIEEVAKEMNVAIRTCKLRYKELLEAMVEVAKKLPWGKEVNIKNIVKNAPSLLKYMEMKSLEERQSEKAKFSEDSDGFDLADVVGECLNKEVGYGGFDGGAQNSVRCLDGLQRLENLKVAHEELAKVYSKFKAEFSNRRPMNENDSVGYGDRLSGLGFQLIDEWWDGRSELCEKLLMEQLLEKDVGLDALPPSYVRGCLAVKRRQEKIRAAKVRINSIVNPATSISSNVSMQVVWVLNSAVVMIVAL
ncbi:Plant-specific TFIIB-related protein PTF2, partial [Bienertia sinuspersici]